MGKPLSEADITLFADLVFASVGGVKESSDKSLLVFEEAVVVDWSDVDLIGLSIFGPLRSEGGATALVMSRLGRSPWRARLLSAGSGGGTGRPAGTGEGSGGGWVKRSL